MDVKKGFIVLGTVVTVAWLIGVIMVVQNLQYITFMMLTLDDKGERHLGALETGDD